MANEVETPYQKGYSDGFCNTNTKPIFYSEDESKQYSQGKFWGEFDRYKRDIATIGNSSPWANS